MNEQQITTIGKKPWVVIPTYNEKINIGLLIERLFGTDNNLSILIVDDSSPDGTATVVKELQNKHQHLYLLVRPKKSGLGKAYIDGFGYALRGGASEVVQMDADFSHDPDDVARLLAALEKNDVSIGSRYHHGISVINWPLRRLILSLTANIYAKIITGLPFDDATGGFRAWRAEALRAIDFQNLNVDGYGFQIAMLFMAWKKGLKIEEIAIVFTERREGHSKMTKAIIREAMLLVWRLRFLGK